MTVAMEILIDFTSYDHEGNEFINDWLSFENEVKLQCEFVGEFCQQGVFYFSDRSSLILDFNNHEAILG